jgi:hypothetical protein
MLRMQERELHISLLNAIRGHRAMEADMFREQQAAAITNETQIPTPISSNRRPATNTVTPDTPTDARSFGPSGAGFKPNGMNAQTLDPIKQMQIHSTEAFDPFSAYLNHRKFPPPPSFTNGPPSNVRTSTPRPRYPTPRPFTTNPTSAFSAPRSSAPIAPPSHAVNQPTFVQPVVTFQSARATPPFAPQFPYVHSQSGSTPSSYVPGTTPGPPMYGASSSTATSTNSSRFFNAMLWVDSTGMSDPTELSRRFPDASNPLYTGIQPKSKDSKRSHLSDKIQWNGRLDLFPNYKKTIEAHMIRNDAGYCVNPTFLARYMHMGTSALWEFPYLNVNETQLFSDCQFLMGTLQYSCRNGGGESILLGHQNSNDGIRAWHAFLQRYDNAGDRETCAAKYRKILRARYTRGYRGGLQQFVADFQYAFAQLDSLGFTDSEADKRRQLIEGCWHEDTTQLLMICQFAGYSYDQIAQLLTTYGVKGDHSDQEHAIIHAQRAQTNNPGYPPHSTGDRPRTPTNFRPRTPQNGSRPLTPADLRVPAPLWNALSAAFKDQLQAMRNELLAAQGPRLEDTRKDPNNGRPPSPARHNSATPVASGNTQSLPRQYGAPTESRMANLSIRQNDSDSDDDMDANTLSLVDDYLSHDPRNDTRRAYMTTRSICAPTTTMVDIRAFLSRNPPGTFYAISDAGADATIIGDGWYVDEFMLHRKANIIGFDEKVARKNGLPIVSAYTTVVLPDGRRVLLRAHEVVYNKGSAFTLLSEYQCRDYGCIVDSVSRAHRLTTTTNGTQCFQPPSLDDPIPFELRGCLMAFQHYLPTRTDMNTLTPVDITSKLPWDPNAHYESPLILPVLHTTTATSSTSIPTSPLPPVEDLEAPNLVTVAPPFDLVFQQPCAVVPPSTLSPVPAFDIAIDDVASQYSDSNASDMLPDHHHDSSGPVPLSHPPAVPSDNVEPPYAYDPSDATIPLKGNAFHLTFDFRIFLREHEVDAFLETLTDDELFGRTLRCNAALATPDPFNAGGVPHLGGVVPESDEPVMVTHSSHVEPQRYTKAFLQEATKYLGYRPLEVVMHTLNNTTQLGTTSYLTFPMRRHFKPRNPQLNVNRLKEAVACDTFFANCRDQSGAKCAQVFFGCASKMINVYGMTAEREAPDAYKDFIREEGAPTILRRDNSKVQTGKAFTDINRTFVIKDGLTEPYHPQQNPAEMRAVKWLKSHSQVLMDRNEVPPWLWFQVVKYLADLHNHCADETLRWRTPLEIRHGDTPDISAFLQFEFYEPIYYLDSRLSFPSSKEKPGRWLGVAHNVGDNLTYRILCDESNQILNRSVVRSALDRKAPNRRVTFDTPLPGYDDDDELLPPVQPPTPVHAPAPSVPLTPGPIPTPDSLPTPGFIPTPGPPPVPPPIPPVTPILGPPRRKLHLQYGSSPIPIDKSLNPPPHRKRNARDRSKKQKKAKKAAYLPPTIHAVPPIIVSTVTEGEDGDSDDSDDDEDGLTDDDDPGPPVDSYFGDPDPPRRSARHTKPTTFFGCKSQRSSSSSCSPVSTETTTAPLPDPRLTCCLSTIQDGVDSSPHMFPTHEFPLPTEPDLTDHSPPPFGNILDLDLNAMSTRVAQQINYLAHLDALNDATDDDPTADIKTWRCLRILKHKVCKAKGRRLVFVKAEWVSGDCSWVQMQSMLLHDSYVLIRYASDHDLLNHKDWKWVSTMVKDDAQMNKVVRAHNAAIRSAPKYKFGIEIPRGIRHAFRLDKENDNTLWQDSIVTELKQLDEYQTFRVPDEGEDLSNYQCIPYHIIFDVKFDLRRKARLVAGGNHTDPPAEDIYSGVVGLETVRLGFVLARHNGLLCCAADVGNAFLYGRTREKVYIIAGPEFGPLQGQRLIVDRSLYGLRSSAARFHEHFAAKLRGMGFRPSYADADFWVKDCGDHYEYIATYVDDLLVFSRNPMQIIEEIKSDYILKGIGEPEYYLGGNIEPLDETWGGGAATALSARTYITNVIEKFEQMLAPSKGVPFALRNHSTPMADSYHPETDDSPLLNAKEASQYRAMIGSANWIITLGRVDICYAIQAMSRFNMAPRIGHLEAMKRVFGYLKKYPKGRIVVDTSFPDHSAYKANDFDNWSEFYPDASEELPPNMPTPKGRAARITCFVDADHAHDVVTRRSITGILLFINNTPVKWISKRQPTVETSTYGSELVAARVAIDTIIEFRYKLRMLGVPIDGPAMMLGDNMSVVLNTTIPSSMLKKKHNAIAYHRVREAIAAKIVRFAHIPSVDNMADILTKPLPSEGFHRLVKPLLFRQASSTWPDRGAMDQLHNKRGVAEENANG